MFIDSLKSFAETAAERVDVRKTLEEIEKSDMRLENMEAVLNSPFAEIHRPYKEVLGEIAKRRMPEMLHTSISDKLIAENITPKAWDAADYVDRNNMMRSMFHIMLEEMKVPQQVREAIGFSQAGTLDLGGGYVEAGSVNRFVERVGNRFEIAERPFVEMHCNLMYQDFDMALRSVFNQAQFVLQQSCCLESAGTYLDPQIPDMRQKLEQEIVAQANGIETDTSFMDAYALEMEMLFVEKYESMLQMHDTYGKFAF